MADILFIDWEGRGPDLPKIGGLNYALDSRTRITLLTYCFDMNGPVKSWVPDLSDLLGPEAWEMVKSMVDSHTVPPPEVVEHVKNGGMICAWYAAFDRTMWQQIATPELGFPELNLKQCLDAMAQAAASNLSGALHQAGIGLNMGGKTEGGKGNMLMFADLEQEFPKQRAPWDEYIRYGLRDTELLRDIWYATRPLSLEEWEQYWAAERINERGICIDEDVCRGAIKYREEELKYIAGECSHITDGDIAKPTMTKTINQWVFARLPQDLQHHMVKERNEDGDPIRLSLDKQRLTLLLEDVKQHDAPPDDNVIDLLELLQHGRASSAIKFGKMLDQAVDGRLCNSYIFNGAGQTGRFSSRGIQMHNLPRDRLPDEIELLDMIAADAPIEQIRAYGPVNYVLARLIRPTLIAEEGKVFVWGDWSAIEARVLPWLAGTRRARHDVLVPFEQGIDVYALNAAKMFGRDYKQLVELLEEAERREIRGIELNEELKIAVRQRQAAKVAVLALGFGGSVGAYRAMARGYGMRVTNEEAKYIVDGWRAANPWARSFWFGTLDAAKAAIRNPGVFQKIGRLSYVFNPDLMDGTLLCFMPDGRPLAYPRAKIKSEKNKFGRMSEVIYYLNKTRQHSLWYGILVENPVQGYAASLLRELLLKLDKYDNVVFHTHDEGGLEVPEKEANYWTVKLTDMMEEVPDHAKGLPLKASVRTDTYYHK